jgi:hypothetical protein
METGRFAPLSKVVEALEAHTVVRFEIPHDFTDGFQAAFWRRPGDYLDPQIRATSSTFASLPSDLVETGVTRLRQDLDSGEWARRHQDVLAMDRVDHGHRVVVTGSGATRTQKGGQGGRRAAQIGEGSGQPDADRGLGFVLGPEAPAGAGPGDSVGRDPLHGGGPWHR